ncbi:acyl-CoA mutase large subunit family protein [Miltoncostaea oceani]|uniref:acyl-CoA mutase large subunit family protein n=1 Tax=Miltoncostaea oceani TaxID=2843216 RepID=UPI003CCE7D5F
MGDTVSEADGPGRDADRGEWGAAYARARLRDVPFETMSGVPVDPVYGDGPLPGTYPYTRGPHASMYRSRLWTMRMFAGFGTAADTNRRFRDLLAAGGTGLSTAFDMPTLMGVDSDAPLARGEVGRAGVAVDVLPDVEDLFAGIDLGAVSTSLTINGPAAILLAMYVAAAERGGVARRDLSGTIQNDIFKEYQAQKEYIFPPRPSVRLVTDTIAFATAEMPRWHPVSISGYHIREAGSTAAQELAFTLANGFAYVEAAVAAGLAVDDFAPRLSFFFNCHIDFFEEIGKLRAARRIWARWMRERYGARDPRSLVCRFHTQTAGVSLTASQPEVNIARVALQALAAALGGTQSLHTDAYDEALALPSERAARIALRTQQVIAHETGVAHVADPLGGSDYVEWMTDEMERRAEEVFAHLLDIGGGTILEGVYEGVEQGWFVGEIADAAYRFEREVNAGRRIVVGVNAFTDDGDEPPGPTLRIDPDVERRQVERLGRVRSERSAGAVDAALADLRAGAAEPTRNLMPPLIDAVRAHATEGEIVATLASVFGTHVERIVV